MKKKLLKRNCIFLLLLIFSFSSKAQTFPVSGKVTDDSSKVLEGATVQEKGTKNSTITRPDGSFQLNLASGKAKLVVSSVGYETLELSVDNNAQLSPVLKAVNQSLTDVV